LDYYTRTVFEINATSGLGAQNAVGGGGRYDTLIENLGGPKVPAIGFAAGIERIAILLNEKGVKFERRSPQLTFICADTQAKADALVKCAELRKRGIFAEFDHKERSIKAQMRRADKMNSKTIIVLGERERAENTGQIKDLKSGQVKTIALTTDSIDLALRE
jgi:histidyl-tRNA synthetase